VFGEAGASGSTTTLKGKAANGSTSFDLVGGGKANNLVSAADAKAEGWGYCMLATEKLLCEQINGLAGSTTRVAEFDNAARVCRFLPGYSQTFCEILLQGTWNANTGNCTYVPKV
jgi:hypothetical protein